MTMLEDSPTQIAAPSGWVLRFDGCELYESDALGVHVALVILTLGEDTFDIDPAGSPSRLMAWIAAMLSVGKAIDLSEAQQLVSLAKAGDIFAAFTPRG